MYYKAHTINTIVYGYRVKVTIIIKLVFVVHTLNEGNKVSMMQLV